MSYQCKACIEVGKTWNGSDPRCGFTGPAATFFSTDNWNCATLERLRELVFEGQELPAGVDYQYCNDQKYATVHIDDVRIDGEPFGLAMWLTWYKSRGTTEAVYVLDSTAPPRAPTEAEVIAVVEHYEALAKLKRAA